MTSPRFRYDAATDELVGPGPYTPCRVPLDAVPAIAVWWRGRGWFAAADDLERVAAEVIR